MTHTNIYQLQPHLQATRQQNIVHHTTIIPHNNHMQQQQQELCNKLSHIQILGKMVWHLAAPRTQDFPCRTVTPLPFNQGTFPECQRKLMVQGNNCVSIKELCWF